MNSNLFQEVEKQKMLRKQDIKKMTPMNIDLLLLNKDILRQLGEVTSKDVYEQNSTIFKRDGLFSTVIFGQVGSKERLKNFGYINMYLDIFHPRAYKELVSLSSLYKGILEGKKYAKFDTKLKDFVETDALEGETGYGVFFKYFDQIQFKITNSVQRKFKILFLKKYKLEDLKIKQYLVIPAGLRDYVVTENNKVLENAINNLYRKLLTIVNTAKQFQHETRDVEIINTIRVRLQKAVIEIYDYLENMLDGKSKFIQGKWTKRALFYGTRNVITGTPEAIKSLNTTNRRQALSAVVGPLQAAKGIMPITIFNIRTKFLHDIIDVESTNANLIDKETLKRTSVPITEKARSIWISDEGIENLINKFIQPEIFMSPVEIEGERTKKNYYLYLVVDKGDEIILAKDISEIPEEDKKYVRPMTYLELLYITLYDIISGYPAYLTRYPVTGYGSTVITIPYLKATTKTRKVTIKNSYLDQQGKIAPEYPLFKKGITPYYSLAIPHIYLEGLGADFDGEELIINKSLGI